MTFLELEFTGPDVLMSGRADGLVDAWLHETAGEYMAEGLSEIGVQMDTYFKDPTPYYETQVVVDQVGDLWVLHDRGVIYGPWLDGSGTRNASSRFKGYPHWRRTLQHLEHEEGPALLERRLRVLFMRLGG